MLFFSDAGKIVVAEDAQASHGRFDDRGRSLQLLWTMHRRAFTGLAIAIVVAATGLAYRTSA
ncbi:hypothetical protein [Luteimonas sp. R10]|uniref:hypothetical protein n=1 Tax=Luteimonas sp. R10 TaxID=3108176 RepID=UPI003084ED7A|nr:hypothetical protein U3649_05935 [Luteimonas sp. R10]